MGKIGNELLALNSAKHAIRQAINDYGGRLDKAAPMAVYPDEIRRVANITWDVFNLDKHRVIFIDWDGTILKDTLVFHGEPVLPPAIPEKWNGSLVFQEWTHPEEYLAAVKKDMIIGATYSYPENVLLCLSAFNKGLAAAPTVKISGASSSVTEIDWGDGEITEVTGSEGNFAHNFADGKTEHVITVKKISRNATATVAASTCPYSVMIPANTSTWTDASNAVVGYSWPVGKTTYSSISSSNARYMNVHSCVVPRGCTSSIIVLSNCRRGIYYLAVAKDFTRGFQLSYHRSGTTYINNFLQFPVLEAELTSVTANFLLIERFAGGTIPQCRIYGSSSSVIIMMSAFILNRCFFDNVSSNSESCLCVSGSFEEFDAAITSILMYDLIGLEKLLWTLPITETTRTVRIGVNGTNSPLDGLISPELITSLNEKGYTVTIYNVN